MYYTRVASCMIVEGLVWAAIACNVYITSSLLVPERFVMCT